MKILFITSFAVIVPSPERSHPLFLETLGLPLQPHAGDDYYFSEALAGAKHFGIWPLSQAAEACFGSGQWPAGRAVPQACVEFEVADEPSVHAAAQELRDAGHELLHPVKTEPWGQTIARTQTTDGVIVGISYAPWMHTAPDAVPGSAAEKTR